MLSTCFNLSGEAALCSQLVVNLLNDFNLFENCAVCL